MEKDFEYHPELEVGYITKEEFTPLYNKRINPFDLELGVKYLEVCEHSTNGRVDHSSKEVEIIHLQVLNSNRIFVVYKNNKRVYCPIVMTRYQGRNYSYTNYGHGNTCSIYMTKIN